jgi:hypothetical protein
MNIHEAMDSMADWGHANADMLKEHTALEAERKAELAADWGLNERNEGADVYAPQGRIEQSWPLRSGSPEWAVYDPSEDDERTRMDAVEAWVMLLVYIASAGFVAWCLGMVAAYVREWL